MEFQVPESRVLRKHFLTCLRSEGGLVGTPEATHHGSFLTCNMLRLPLRENDDQMRHEVSGEYED